MATKYNFSGVRDWNLLPSEELGHCVENMMRIGMSDITDENIKQVVKRTNKATACNLQIPGFPHIRPITVEDIQRWKGFTSNIAFTTSQMWHVMMKTHFPYVLDFPKQKSKAEKLGWHVEEKQTGWLLRNDLYETSSWFYSIEQYLTEVSVWQDAMARGLLK